MSVECTEVLYRVCKEMGSNGRKVYHRHKQHHELSIGVSRSSCALKLGLVGSAEAQMRSNSTHQLIP